MESIRKEVLELQKLGQMPDDTNDDDVSIDTIKKYDDLLRTIKPPLSKKEAEILVRIMPNKLCYGMESTVLHLLETTPEWSEDIINMCPSEFWKNRMLDRINGVTE